MGFGIFFLALLGGYVFVIQWNYTRFLAARESGYRLLFRSATAGVVLGAIAHTLVQFSLLIAPPVDTVAAYTSAAPFLGTAMVAFALGACAWWPLNTCCSRRDGAKRAVLVTGDSIEALLLDALERQMLVEVTMKSRKVYIGWVLYAHEAPSERTAIPVLPLASGYRTDELRLELTMDYATAYDECLGGDDPIPGLQQGDFQVLLPVPEVASIRLFDPEAYERFNRPAAAFVASGGVPSA